MEDIISRAFRTGDHQLAESQIACQTAAQTQIFCPMCENILDRQDVVVFEATNPDGSVSVGCNCLACHKRILPKLKRTAEKAKTLGVEYVFHTWKGRLEL